MKLFLQFKIYHKVCTLINIYHLYIHVFYGKDRGRDVMVEGANNKETANSEQGNPY